MIKIQNKTTEFYISSIKLITKLISNRLEKNDIWFVYSITQTLYLTLQIIFYIFMN
jgi:hypothetical protein